jgi:hypothetical protein
MQKLYQSPNQATKHVNHIQAEILVQHTSRHALSLVPIFLEL